MCLEMFSLPSRKGAIVLFQLSFLAAFCSLQKNAMADLLHLRNGSIVDIGWDYHEKGDKLVIQKKGGHHLYSPLRRGKGGKDSTRLTPLSYPKPTSVTA